MHREESLQWFLIKRFIYILVLVTIVQSLISMLITRVILPVIMQVYFPKILRNDSSWQNRAFVFSWMCAFDSVF